MVAALNHEPLAYEVLGRLSALGTQATDFGNGEDRPLRILTHLGQISARLDLSLSWPECLLLCITPFVVQALVFQVLRAIQLASRKQATADDEPLIRRYQRFAAAQQDVIDRIESLQMHGFATEAEWVRQWIARRFLCQERIEWRTDLIQAALSGVTAPPKELAGLLAPQLIAGLARAAGMEAKQLREIAKGNLVSIAIGGASLPVRLPLLATLLLWAERETLSPWDLSETLVHHLGQDGGLRLTVLNDDFAQNGNPPAFSFESKSRITTLQATCSTAVLDFALREYAERWETFLREQQHVLEQIIPGIPVQCNLNLTPRTRDEADAKPTYHTPHVHFSMNVEQVRRLLMTDSLWGEPALAYRELYQNALDACRYRRAITDYYNAFYGHEADRQRVYAPRIIFREGEENGRRYVECQDNGVGMNPEIIRFLFARAGNQFSRSTEFLQEQAKWREQDPKLEFAPNSQFGIGVFSYFLVAESIEVITRRLSAEDCEPEPDAWRVMIRAPSSLFTLTQMEKAHAPREPGTRIRLYLRTTTAHGERPARAVDVLRKLVWFTEVELKATGYGQSAEWQAGAVAPGLRQFTVPQDPTAEPRLFWLAPRKPGLGQTYDDGRERVRLREFRPSPAEPSLKYEHMGRVLVDGIVTDHIVPFVILNLYGPEEKPRLSINRNQIRSWNVQRSLSRLHERLDSAPLKQSWLDDYWKFDPIGCTRIAERMNNQRKQWSFCGQSVSAGAYPDGFCYLPEDAAALKEALPLLHSDDSYVVSGQILLRGDTFSQTLFLLWRAAYWRRLQRPIELSGRAYGEPMLAEGALHYVDPLIQQRWATMHAGLLDAALMSSCADWPEWAPFEVLRAACLAEATLPAAWDALARLCDILDIGPPPRPPTVKPAPGESCICFDEVLPLSQGEDAVRPWLTSDSLPWLAMRFAVRWGMSLQASVQHLMQLAARAGVHLPAPWSETCLQAIGSVSQDDLALLNREPDGSGYRLSIDELTPLHLLRAARARGWAVERCADRLQVLLPFVGWSAPPWLSDRQMHDELAQISDDDLILLRRPEIVGQPLLVDPTELTPMHLLQLQKDSPEVPVQTCARRLARLAKRLRWPPPLWNAEQLDQLADPVLDLLRMDYRSGGDLSRVVNDMTLFQFARSRNRPLRDCAREFQRAAGIAGVPAPSWTPELLPDDVKGTELASQLLQREADQPDSFVSLMEKQSLPLAQVRIASEITGLQIADCAVHLERLAAGLGWERPRWVSCPGLLTQVAEIPEAEWQYTRYVRSITLPNLLEYAARNSLLTGETRLAPLLGAMRVLGVAGPAGDESALLALAAVRPVDSQLARYASAWQHFRGSRPTSAGMMVALCALVNQPAWLVHQRLAVLSPLTGLPPPGDEATYLDVRWSQLVQRSLPATPACVALDPQQF